MSVGYDKFIGYRIDITEEFKSLEERNEKFHDSLLFSKSSPESLKNLGYVPYFETSKFKKGDITIIYDGMNGEYTYLILIQAANINSYYYDENDNVDEYINEMLSTFSISKEIINRLNQIYKLIFDTENKKEIECKVFVHVT